MGIPSQHKRMRGACTRTRTRDAIRRCHTQHRHSPLDYTTPSHSIYTQLRIKRCCETQDTRALQHTSGPSHRIGPPRPAPSFPCIVDRSCKGAWERRPHAQCDIRPCQGQGHRQTTAQGTPHKAAGPPDLHPRDAQARWAATAQRTVHAARPATAREYI